MNEKDKFYNLKIRINSQKESFTIAASAGMNILSIFGQFFIN